MDYLPSFFIGVKKRIAALFIGTTIRFLSFYSILLFPENITSWPHSIFFFSDYNLRRNRCYNLVPDRTVCVRPPGADLSVSGLNRCSQPLQLISRFWLDPRFFKSRMFLHYPDTCRLFIDPVCHRAVCVVVK